MTVRLKAHSPTCATGTGHCKSAPHSHNGKGFITASEDSLFVPVFAISLAKALYSCRALHRVPEKIVLKPLV